jgi:hypothetical protein
MWPQSLRVNSLRAVQSRRQTMKPIWLISVLALGLLITPSFADELSHRKAAAELLEITNVRQMLEQVKTSAAIIMNQQFDAIKLPEEGREAAARAQQEMMDWLSQVFAWEKTKDMYVDIYVETFTEDELNELIVFNQSPLGQKVLRKMPQLMQRSMDKTQQVLHDMAPGFQRRLRKIILELQERYRA